MRQRLRSRTSPLASVGRLVLLLVSLALVWYGLMVVLLALKVDAGTVNAISGYRTVFDELAALRSDDIGDTTRIVTAIAGVLACLLFGWLALNEIPRPYLARNDVELEGSDRGELTVEARAVERAAEIAACHHPSVASASGRYATDTLELAVTVRRARGVADTLTDVQARARASLAEHELPAVPVNVSLSGFDRRHRRELD